MANFLKLFIFTWNSSCFLFIIIANNTFLFVHLSMDVAGGYDPRDSGGFIKVSALR